MNSKKLLASLVLCLLPLGSFTANASEDQPLSPLGVGIHLGFNLGGALPPTGGRVGLRKHLGFHNEVLHSAEKGGALRFQRVQNNEALPSALA